MKPKALVHLLSTLLVLPFWILELIFAKLMGPDRSFQMFSQFFSLFPGMPGNFLRSAYYKLSLYKSEYELNIGFGTLFSQRNTELGKRIYIGPQCNIGLSKIGHDTLLGSGVHILSGTKQHGFDDLETPIQQQGGEFEKIEIGEDSWIGNNSVIAANIGNKCVIGAGSVVTKPIPDFAIAAGNPAKVIRFRNTPKDSID